MTAVCVICIPQMRGASHLCANFPMPQVKLLARDCQIIATLPNRALVGARILEDGGCIVRYNLLGGGLTGKWWENIVSMCANEGHARCSGHTCNRRTTCVASCKSGREWSFLWEQCNLLPWHRIISSHTKLVL